MNDLSDLKFSLHSPAFDKDFQADWEVVSNNKNNVIAGFLSIGNKDGWKFSEGGPHELGFRFTRYMFKKFCIERASNFVDYKDIFDHALEAFASAAQRDAALTPRASIDATVTGWYQHSVSRIVGFLGMAIRQNGPYFEILINSAKTSQDDPGCYPFKTLVLANNEEAKKRWESVRKLDKISSPIAYPAFYHSPYQSPEAFLSSFRQAHGKDPGPNSLRMLEGLQYLSLKKMKAQTIGNCWMKQNKRQVLVLLFVETLTRRPELSVADVWKLSHTLYKKWTQYTRDELKAILSARKGISLDLAALAEAKLKTAPERLRQTGS